jgi:hypothetical protein
MIVFCFEDSKVEPFRIMVPYVESDLL